MKPFACRIHNLGRVSRRRLLRAGAVSLALPLLEAMLPVGVGAEEKTTKMRPRRLLLIGRVLGTHGDFFFPKDVGLRYTPSRYLKFLEPHRGQFTVFSGLSHLGYPNVHHTECALFTGAAPERIQRLDDIRNTQSLDQLVAARIGSETRIPGLAMGGLHVLPMVYSAKGSPIPLESRPEAVFQRLFVSGNAEEVAREVRRLSEGRSVLDQVRGQLSRLMSTLGPSDRDRIDLMTTSIREAEKDLNQQQVWAFEPKPKVGRKASEFANPGWSSGQKMRYDLAFLAFQTDSTRVAVAIEVPGRAGDAPGSALDHHDASHHGMSAAKIEQLALYEEEQTRNLGQLLDKLAAAGEGGEALLTNTTVLWASNLGNASSHSSTNLPILVAGGGFRHQGHVAFDPKQNRPLSNLYLRVLHQMRIEEASFGSSTGALGEIG